MTTPTRFILCSRVEKYGILLQKKVRGSVVIEMEYTPFEAAVAVKYVLIAVIGTKTSWRGKG